MPHTTVLLNVVCLWLISVGVQAATLLGEDIPDRYANALVEILDNAGIASAEVSVSKRTSYEQARLMFDLYLKEGAVKCKRNETCQCASLKDRIDCAKQTYCAMGDMALELVRESMSRHQAIDTMKSFFDTSLPGNKICLMHIRTSPPSPHFILGVLPNSIPKTRHSEFIEAVRVHPLVIKERFFIPGRDAVRMFHIEMRK